MCLVDESRRLSLSYTAENTCAILSVILYQLEVAMGKQQKPRTYYKYEFKIGNKIVHGGITEDLERRESEHQQRRVWGKGHIKQVGRKTTEGAARAWEEKKGYD